MALVPATSAQRFNGGAISGALDVAYTGAPATVPLTVTGSALQTPANDWTLVQVEDGNGVPRFVLESNGTVDVVMDGANAGGFHVQSTTPGGEANFDVDLLSFFGVAAVPRPSVTGALSTVVDPAAKAVLTSLLAALVALGLATDGTT